MTAGGHNFQLVANPVFNSDGERLGTVVEWLDRTAEVAAERELDALLMRSRRAISVSAENGRQTGIFP
ncbi:hypothetical protein [Chromatium okenii]|uniref:PAC domain-containing protein n=1 Tax=Chromatium okenii TaxID=61644 RepID=A0A2S7XP82_9GAMM|nr:hypothetical protein [Chromatium okenii]PQJ95191.1 hypothetical protein CXB77_12990 [Chromatium okenii]